MMGISCHCYRTPQLEGSKRKTYRYKLNIWDVGGQKSIRSYWRNYFEQTDALVWVVDSADRLRLSDCREELKQLLQEEVSTVSLSSIS